MQTRSSVEEGFEPEIEQTPDLAEILDELASNAVNLSLKDGWIESTKEPPLDPKGNATLRFINLRGKKVKFERNEDGEIRMTVIDRDDRKEKYAFDMATYPRKITE